MLDLLIGLLGGRNTFYLFESRILDEVKSRLSEESRAKFQLQIDAVDKIQRLSGGKEVNLHRTRHGKAEFDADLLFLDIGDEELLATVQLASTDKSARLKVDVWLVNGRLFSLLFSLSPAKFYAGLNLKTVDPDIVDVKIWFTPDQADRVVLDRHVDNIAGLEWLDILAREVGIAPPTLPLQQIKRLDFLKRIDAVLPSDYLECVAHSEGVRLKSGVIYGLSQIGQLVSLENNYYSLADVYGVGILAVEAGYGPELYLLYHESGGSKPVGTSFREALESLLHESMLMDK